MAGPAAPDRGGPAALALLALEGRNVPIVVEIGESILLRGAFA
jgi:hypothetical protein